MKYSRRRGKSMFFILIFVVVGVGILLKRSHRRIELPSFIQDDKPVVVAGRKLFLKLRCLYCHRVGGMGGNSGPALDQGLGSLRKTGNWLREHYRDNQIAVAEMPGAHKPNDREVSELIAYQKSLQRELPYTDDAPKLFAKHCAMCHRIGDKGSIAGPNLSRIGTLRDKRYISRYITDPGLINPTSSMPGYRMKLADIQIEDLARYLASLGR
ncbi:MAG: c-type cytochrome [Elusimicrobia bacterium]|nr:c-type cytochrome [Elusimicrobiota bacterium]